MRSLNAAALTHIAQTVTTLAVCWRINPHFGNPVLGTEHDRPITVSLDTADEIEIAGTYLSTAGITGSDIKWAADLSVTNSEVKGYTNRPIDVVDIRPEDIDAGLYDRAEVVVFLVNYLAPDDFAIILNSGTLGDITRVAEGRYDTEIRGLAEKLKLNFMRTYGLKCSARFGDQRCKVDLAPLRISSTVTAVTSRRLFSASGALGSTGPLPFGIVQFTTGLNAGFSMDIKAFTSPDISLFLPMPRDIVVGDALVVTPGCDLTHRACFEDWNNLLNFRGHGFYIKGPNSLLKFGGQQRLEEE